MRVEDGVEWYYWGRQEMGQKKETTRGKSYEETGKATMKGIEECPPQCL